MTALSTHTPVKINRIEGIILSLLLLLVLMAGAYFRLTGLYWGEYQYLHPDERFLVWVGSDISPVKSVGEYFNTSVSSLNPQNRGHGFYVYGTLPMFLARYIVEWVYGVSGFLEMTNVGRALSAAADLMTVFLVYLAARDLYDKRVGVLAAAFSAAVVLQIQQAHFFTMDSFLTMFSFLAFYFAVLVLKNKKPDEMVIESHASGTNKAVSMVDNVNSETQTSANILADFVRDPLFLPSLGFGVALGMATASKLNAAAVAIVLPVAMVLYVLHQPKEEREMKAVRAFVYLVMAAIVSLFVFRIFQPYAFSGPGFLGIKPNPLWVDNIREQRAQSSGEVDFPPAMQWARRPIWFSFQNMVLWGFGLPLGLLVWAGFLWAGWRLISNWNRRDREWYSHALVLSWTALYFAWQSIQLNPTMRYELPIYPTLVILGAWALIALYDRRRRISSDGVVIKNTNWLLKLRWEKIGAITIGGVVLISTFAYAFGFTQIYVRPITRIAASRWIYQNLPGPITLPIQTKAGVENQILPFPYDYRIQPQLPYSATFKPQAVGTITQVELPDVVDDSLVKENRSLAVTFQTVPPQDTPLASGSTSLDAVKTEAGGRQNHVIQLDQPVLLEPEKTYNVIVSLPYGEPATSFNPDAEIGIAPFSGSEDIAFQNVRLRTTQLHPSVPLELIFQSDSDGYFSELNLSLAPGGEKALAPEPLGVSLQPMDPNAEALFSTVKVLEDPEKGLYRVQIVDPIPVTIGEKYQLSLSLEPRGGKISLSGIGLANEGEWDDGLPLRIDGYDGFGGIYPLDLNFNMYWDDNQEKLERFIRILDQSEYIAISSSRQWGSLPRIPERFPLTTVYYRNLIGCPPEETIEYCYRTAKPGMYQGKLGFELVQTFTSEPSLGLFRLNDQFAEEAFTVYDHPKVLIFKKTAGYDEQKVRDIFSQVDFTKIIRKPPLKYSGHPEDLMLPERRWSEQQAGGTWSQLFDTGAPINRFQPLGVLVWYLSVSLLGLLFYPILRLALPGLADHGYPFARIAGMLTLSYIVWLAGSFMIPFSRTTISIALGLLCVGGLAAGIWQRGELIQEWNERKRYFLIVEGLVLAFFLAFLLVRFGNPDLWHPWKGGEKPMDFSYFNAVLKSSSFPPYDPWYAGGYLNYYYYGYVLVGVLAKWLGIVPSFAYNLILPTLFSMIAMGAFSLAWNLSKAAQARRDNPENEYKKISAYIPGLAASLGMAVLGNLGIIRMFYQGFQKLAAPGGLIEDAGIFTRWVWTIRGFVQTLNGANLPYGIGDWYWLPSRIIPAPGDVEPITEFPYFTVLYADLHAHLIALPLTLLALTFIIGIVLGKARWKKAAGCILWFMLGALAIGSLRPTNTWDLPPYLGLAAIGFIYAVFNKSHQPTDLDDQKNHQKMDWWLDIPLKVRQFISAFGGAALLIVLTLVLFQPYAHWYALGYTHIDLWNGTHTPIRSYLYHWGLFLIAIVPWMIWETRDWLAKTPLSSLRKLEPYRLIIQILLAFVLLMVGLLMFWRGVAIAWLVLPLAVWAGVLILRPGQPDAKRIVLFLIGTGLVLTLMVEIVVLRGDIGRMNTVFKFYLQVWTMFAISAAAALSWLWPALKDWTARWQIIWQAGFFMIVAGASLYPLMATMAKIRDRMADEAPHTLDGMTYMRYATYTDDWGPMDLSQDYQAIRWLQENVQGSPVIVEANLRDLYRWGSRDTIYTGLPGVVGWEWHQQQQRAVVPGAWISDRILEIDAFYLTEDWKEAQDFLEKYNVRYIIVGQQERGHYPGPGLDKFEQANGILWQEVFRTGETVIYEVNEMQP